MAVANAACCSVVNDKKLELGYHLENFYKVHFS